MQLLEPIRFSFIVVGVVAFVFLINDQGMEILRAFGETFQARTGESEHDARSIVAFYIALIFLGLTNWYFPRLLLNVRFPNSPDEEELQTAWLRLLRKWTPRITGMLPAIIAALGCIRVARSYDAGGTTPLFLYLLGAGCFGVAVSLAVFFEVRRRFILNEQLFGDGAKPLYCGVKEMLRDRGARRALALLLTPSLLLVFLFAAWPVVPAQVLGAAAILMLASATWAAFGSLLSYFGSTYRFPSLLAILAWAGICSLTNDNHQVRVLEGTEAPKLNVSDALDRWREGVSAAYPLPSGVQRPLFLVAASGGGIRAAYWTALVLATIEDRVGASAEGESRNSFAAHTFAISGVSGGALGASMFNAALVSEERPLRARMNELLDDDYLAPALGRMLFPDLVQRFCPFRLPGCDRAAALELGWEAAWRKGRGRHIRNPLEEELARLFEPTSNHIGPIPNLLLNGTMVESGKRVITSNLAVSPGELGPNQHTSRPVEEFLDTDAASMRMKKKPIRLSTAAHASARFTYVSPAGTFEDGRHVVDGGYFENSGVTAVLDILRVLAEKSWSSEVLPVIVLIDNGPQSTKASGEQAREPVLFGEVRAPLATMLRTREARGTYAQAAAKQATINRLVGRPGVPPVVGREAVTVIEFGLANRGVPLPLGWMLSASATREMNEQIDSSVMSASSSLDNVAAVDTIVRMLHAR